MVQLCDGFDSGRGLTNTQIGLQYANLVIGVTYSATSLFTCFFLYRKKGACKSVPLFVTLQMVALLIMVPFSLTFFSLLILDIRNHDDGMLIQEQSISENSVATVESFLLMVHEWLYTDQFLKTVLWLKIDKRPMFVDSEEEYYMQRKK